MRSVLRLLEKQGAVHDARAVQWYLRLRGEQPRVQAGTYEIPAHASPAEIIRLFIEGKVILEQLTVVEGSTFADFLDLLAKEPDVQHTLAGKTPAQIMAAIGHPGENPEGRFFPDTYRFATIPGCRDSRGRLSGDAAGTRCRLERTQSGDCRSTRPTRR